MPVVTIWRDPKLVDDEMVVKVRDIVHTVVARHLKVKDDEVALRIQQVGPLDKNYSIIGIEIDTGPGKDDWRQEQRVDLGKSIATGIVVANIIPFDWLGPGKSDVWLRILGGGAFVPLGRPDLVR